MPAFHDSEKRPTPTHATVTHRNLRGELLTASEVAEWLAISPAWVRDHGTGRRTPPILPSVRLGKAIRFRERDIEEFLNSVAPDSPKRGRAVISCDLRRIGRSMPRRRGSGRGELKRLGSGRYWARWFVYVDSDGCEKRRPREKVITRDVAEAFRIALDYSGPLTKQDAQRTLDLLIAESTHGYVRPDTAATFEQVARQYLALSEPHWGPHTLRTSKPLIERHLIGSLGMRKVKDLSTADLQTFVNRRVTAGASKSQLQKILLYLRAIFELAVDQRIIDRNPARKLRRQVSQTSVRTLSYARRMSAPLARDDRSRSPDPSNVHSAWASSRGDVRVAPR